MKDGSLYDRVLKDLFQRDHPALLDRLTGGVAVQEFLNVELPRMQERRADLVLLLADGSILHIEFQSHNHKDMAYREGIYCLLIAQKFRRRVRQVVLYCGQAKMNMADNLDLGGTKVSYRLMDIREIPAEDLLRSGRPGDLALAMLAKDGTERLSVIARCAASLPDAERIRALTQLALLSGLRGLSGRLKMEITNMRSSLIDISKNEILRDFMEEAKAEGLAEGEVKGKAEGRAEGFAEGEVKGMSVVLGNLLQAKFGPLPKWATERVRKATAVQISRWAKKVLTASTLEGVLGKK